jgi:apolipoprotein N-acyltransferase
VRIAAALALGAVHALSFAPANAWWLQMLALAAMLALVQSAGPAATWRDRWLPGFAFGVAWFVTGLYWLYISMHDYGGLPAPLAGLAVVAVACYLALFPAVAFASLDALRRRAPEVGTIARIMRDAAAFAGAWTLAEWLRGTMLTGFPWLASGYAHVDGPLAGWAPLLGVYGIGGGSAFAAAALAGAATRRAGMRAVPIALALAATPLAAGFGARALDWSEPVGRPIRVRLIQGAVAQELKFSPVESLRAMQMYAAMVRAGEADLTVLPETAWTAPWYATPPDVLATMFPPGRARGTVALGAPMPPVSGAAARAGATAPSPYAPSVANSVVLVDAARGGAMIAQYDKHHLVPFGEFIPTGFAWFVRMMNIPLGEFARGAIDQPAIAIGDQHVAFNVCYEDLFGEELLPALRGDAARAGGTAAGATILANVSNIGWFGRSLALPQHLGIARMRTLETARPMIRATNTGVTATIDARGQVTARLPGHEVGVLESRVQGTRGLTPFARTGNATALVLALAGLAAGGWPAVRRRWKR